MSLTLSGDAPSIPVIRRILGDALRTLGVVEECVRDIQVAVSEACTNVLQHANPGDSYEVISAVDGWECVLKVVDNGVGFDTRMLRGLPPPPEAERGRGIQLMRALVDDISFETAPAQGTVVYLHKRLRWEAGSPLLPRQEAEGTVA
jgi:serine/threonine-protein kinase RsbW